MKTPFPGQFFCSKKLTLLTLAVIGAFLVAAQPVVNSFSPKSGAVGTTVTISGSNFSTTPSNNIVFFGAAKAIVNTASATTLSVTVPAGVTWQPISVTVNGLTGYAAKPFVVTFAGGALTTNSFGYSASLDNVSNIETNDLTTGDFDGDGKVDVAVVDRLNNHLSVYRNTSTAGNISFGAAINFTTGTQPGSLAAGDLDGDGKTDIAVTNRNDNTVSIFRNTGTPGAVSFAAKVDVGTDAQPLAIALSDFDGDGKTDIATANATLAPSTVSILQNTGSVGAIAFAATNNIPVLAPGSSIVAADLNGDHKADLVVASLATNLVTTLTNTSTTGAISFGAAVNYATGTAPDGLAVGDLDGDNKADVTLANTFANTISVFRNISSGGVITLSAKNDITVNGADQVAIVDGDGDGKPDLAVETGSPGGFSILKNNSSVGAISLGTPLVYPSGCGSGIIAADWDGDGKPDLGIGCGLLRAGFWINKTTGPQITSFTPTGGASGATVTISGVNFTGVTSVQFGGVAASSFSVVNATTITAVVGAGTTGDVTVTSPAGASTLAGFTYTAPPTISSFTPQSALQGTSITITGNNFTGATAVQFGGVAATSFTVVNNTTITATVSTGTSGNVTVTTPYGSATLAGFVFIAPPTITTFNPALGGTGTVVSISGTNFTGATAVSFGNVAASSFTVVSGTLIQATVGNGASGDVSVTTGAGTATKSGFYYFPPPVITSFTPAAAPTGAPVTIKGSNFTYVTSVSFGGVAITSFAINDASTIVANVGNGASGNVTVSSPYGSSTMAGFTYLPPPTISSISPLSGPIGTTVTITGANFTNASAVYFDGQAAASFTVLSPTTISAVTGDGNTGSVQVTTPNGFTVSNDWFTFIYPQPTITSFSPASATTGGTVTITGTNFVKIYAVDFGGVAASGFVINSPTSITATVGAGASGDVRVAGGGGSSSLSGFTYTTPPPTITNFTPGDAGAGQSVTINGSNFTNVTAVTFGGVNATSFVVNSFNTSITAIVGAGATGSVTVTTPTGTASAGNFIYDAPVITSFSPTSGGPGTSVTITGSGFYNVTAVKFGDVPASSITASSLTSITAVVGAGASGDVSVTAQRVTARASGFTYTPSTPAITGVAPLRATTGMPVIITGYKFTGATAVSFGGTAATSFVVNSDTQITAVVGAGASGDVSVTVAGSTLTYPGFIYTTAPIITSLSPESATVGTTVTITGYNFNGYLPGNTVYFGSVKAPVLSGTSTSLIVAVPAGATYQPVTVTTNGLIASSPKPFDVTFTSTGILTAGSFAPKIDSANGLMAGDVAIADIDADGKNDIATIQSENTIDSVFLYKNQSNPGAITLAARKWLVHRKGPQNVDFADLDGDGNLDLFTTNLTDATSNSAYRNTSTGGVLSFDSEYPINTGTVSNFYTVTGDFDGDGKIDMVVASYWAQAIYIFKNQSMPGSLSFATPVKISAGTNIEGIATADMDQDGKPDLVLTTGTGPLFLRNTSTPAGFSFTTTKYFNSPDYSTLIKIADLDGDNRPDVLITNEYQNSFSVYSNLSKPGTIIIGNKKEFVTPALPTGICVADIDGNNKPDVIIANLGNASASVFKNASTTNNILFEPNFEVPTGNSPYAIKVGDIDNDGRPDVLTANTTTKTFSIIRNKLDGYFVTAFSPTSGKEQTVVTIKGTHFTQATGVQFGGTAAASFTIINDTTISAVVATGNTGSVQVAYGAIKAALPGFTYIAPVPTITAFTPTTGSQGTTVTITGTNFTGATSVRFGNVAAQSFTVNSATSITAIVGAGATGVVSVTTPGGTAYLGDFTYNAVTGIYDPVTANSKDLVIQPNPGRTIITVNHPASAKSAYIKFVDVLGRTVKQLTPERNAKQTTVNVTGWQQGVYQVIWSDGTRTLARSFMVN